MLVFVEGFIDLPKFKVYEIMPGTELNAPINPSLPNPIINPPIPAAFPIFTTSN